MFILVIKDPHSPAHWETLWEAPCLPAVGDVFEWGQHTKGCRVESYRWQVNEAEIVKAPRVVMTLRPPE